MTIRNKSQCPDYNSVWNYLRIAQGHKTPIFKNGILVCQEVKQILLKFTGTRNY